MFDLSRALIAVSVLAAAWAWGAPGTAAADPATLRFVRAGVLVEGAGLERAGDFRVNGRLTESASVPGGWLLEWPWLPRRPVHVTWAGTMPGAVTATAPLRPAPWMRWSVPWPPADLLSTAAADEATVLAVSPRGGRMAAGSQQGRIAILSLADGTASWSVQRPGRVIRQLGFDPGGTRLYVGEQGPEGRLAAYAVTGKPGSTLWTFDAARDLGSAVGDPHDPYAWVTQPAAYRVQALGQDVLVAFSRSWSEGGNRRGRSRLYRIDGISGTVRWAFPADSPQRGILTWFAVDRAEGRAVLPVQSPMGAQGEERRPTEVILVDLVTGLPIARRTIQPAPPYPVAAMWRGLALAPEGHTVAATTDDGRAFLWQEQHGALEAITELSLVAPVTLGGVTVTATNGSLAATARQVIFATGPTYVPPEFGGGGEAALNHPRGNTLYAYDWHGRPQWIWRLENDLQGVEADATGHWLAVAQGGERPQPEGSAQGLAVLDLQAGDAERLVYRFPLAGRPVYGALAVSADGRSIALAEAPRRVTGDARPRGATRLHLLR
jgi:hypothetical protein